MRPWEAVNDGSSGGGGVKPTRESECPNGELLRGRWRGALGRNCVIAAMAVEFAAGALLFYVSQLAVCGKFAIPTDDTPASECAKTQEPHETHGPILRCMAFSNLCARPCRHAYGDIGCEGGLFGY